MALRQFIPDFEPAGVLGMNGGKTLLRMRRPAHVEFRAGQNMASVAAEVLASSKVELEAAAAGGKSTLVPAALCRASGLLVVHLCPNKFLADDLCRYVGKNAAADLGATYLDGPSEPWPQSGIVFMSSACLIAKWLECGEVVMPECVVFHDESHESDGYNYLAKVLLPQVDTVRTYVSATATSAPAGFRNVESKGVMVQKVFDEPDTPWDVFDEDKPWFYDGDGDNCLIFEDRKQRAQQLKADFEKAGWEAYRFHSGMALREFRRVMARMRMPNSPCIAIVADSTFRSGFTMPVSRIIDSGYVGMVVAMEGMPKRIQRPATGLERYQAAARGARMPGQRTTYWAPVFDAPMLIHDLEASEVDLAALGMRLLGYNVPREFSGRFGATMGVPRELREVLQGSMPLAALKPDQLVAFEEYATPAGRRSPYLADDVELCNEPYDLHPNVSSDTARKWGLQGARKRVDSVAGDYEGELLAPAPLRPGTAPRVPEPSDYRSDGFEDALQDIYSGEEVDTHLDPNKSYVAVGLGHGEVTSSAFPRGVDSVLAQLANDESGALHLGYDRFTRGVAINLLLDKHNEAATRVAACQGAIVQARESRGGKDVSSLKEWASKIVEVMAKSMHEIRVVDGVLERLMRGHCSVAEISYERHVVDVREGLLGVMQQLPSDKRFVEAVGRGVSRMNVRDSERMQLELPSVAMPTTGRGMRAVSRPKALAEWFAGPRYYTGTKYIKN